MRNQEGVQLFVCADTEKVVDMETEILGYMLKRDGGGTYDTWLPEFGESERWERRTMKTRRNEGEKKQK